MPDKVCGSITVIYDCECGGQEIVDITDFWDSDCMVEELMPAGWKRDGKDLLCPNCAQSLLSHST